MSDIINKAEYIKLIKDKAAENGLSTDALDIIKTAGYFTSMLVEGFEQGVLMGASLQDERFASTAKLKDSFIKLAKDSNCEIDFATPAKTVMSISLYLDEIEPLFKQVTDTRHEYIFSKNSYYVSINGVPFSLLYDIKVIKAVNTSASKNIEPYLYTVYSDNPIDTHPLDVDDIKGIPLNSFKMKSENDSNREMLTFITYLYQFEIVETELRYTKGNGVIEMKTFSFDNELAEFVCYYKAADYETDSVRLEKSIFFNDNIDVDRQTIFYKYKSADSIILINKKVANFVPAINSLLIVESYSSLGKGGNFTYTGSNISLISKDDVVLDAVIAILQQPNGGENMPTIEELRTMVIHQNSSRRTIINQKDLERLYSMSEGIYKIYKTRHDALDNEYSVTIGLYDELYRCYIGTYTSDIYMDLSEQMPMDKEDGRYYPIRHNYVIATEYNVAYLDKSIPDSVLSYIYDIPFYMCYDAKTGFLSMYEKFVNRKYYSTPEYISPDSELQFIVNAINYKKSPNYQYNITFPLITSLPIENERIFHTSNDVGIITDTGELKTRILFKRSGIVLGYVDCTMISYVDSQHYYMFGCSDFLLEQPYGDSVDLVLYDIASNEKIIVNTPMEGITVSVYCFLKDNTIVSDPLFKDVIGYRLINIYTVEGTEFYKDFSSISKIHITHQTPTKKVLRKVPLVEYNAAMNIPERINELLGVECDKLNAIYSLTEQNFSQRVLFANTYGFARRYKVGRYLDAALNSLTIIPRFAVKMKDDTILDEADLIDFIKVYIEGIDFNNGDSLRISLLISCIHAEFPNIAAVEFLGFNNLPSSYQYIGLDPNVINSTSEITVPEILNVEHTYSPSLDAYIPNIEIELI